MGNIEEVKKENILRLFSGKIGDKIYKSSILQKDNIVCFLVREGKARSIVFVSENGDFPEWVNKFRTEQLNIDCNSGQRKCLKGRADESNLKPLWEVFEFTKPVVGGLKQSFGFGDRLGIGTPGHILSADGRDIFPILAQQSIREMSRTKRNPKEVMADACWSVFLMGFDKSFGSDADHLKTKEDIKSCFEAGFLMFTIDPGDYVDNDADTDNIDTLKSKLANLPWDILQTSADELIKKYVGKITLINTELNIAENDVIKSAVKYGKAIAHTYTLYQYLTELAGEGNFELEVSVDETETPTTPTEHFYITSEFNRLGVKFISLAPRFIGRFEKGVDYIGDLDEFRKEFVYHSEIAKKFGPYKISIHSGSDKLSIYPIVAELTEGLVHVKTAGTSYLESLRVIAKVNPELFRKILDFARSKYETDRKTYHVSASVDKVPESKSLKDDELPELLNDFDAREVLHVTFGSVLTERKSDGAYLFKDEFMDTLIGNEELYWDTLKAHFDKHLDKLS